jgi:hypothetical protein
VSFGFRSLRALAGLVLASLALTACARGAQADFQSVDYYLPKRDAQAGKPGPKPPNDTELVFRATKKADGTAFGFVRFNRNLYAPFRVSLVGGLSDPAGSTGFTGNSQFCMELDRRDTLTPDIADLRYVLICARSEGDGIRVRAQDKFAQYGNRFFAATKIVELEIEHNGTDLIFRAGAATFEGGATLVEFARITNHAVTAAYLPSLGSSFLGYPAEISFDKARVELSGAPPQGLSPEQLVANALYPAFDGTLEAVYDLDGGTPDTASARARLVAAQAVVAAQATAIGALAESKTRKQAVSSLKQTGAALAAAVKAIDAAKPQATLAKKVAKALGLVLGTVEILDPLPEGP